MSKKQSLDLKLAQIYPYQLGTFSDSIKALKELGILVYPNKEGYIRKHDCPICKGWKIERIILKPGETYKIIRDEEI